MVLYYLWQNNRKFVPSTNTQHQIKVEELKNKDLEAKIRLQEIKQKNKDLEEQLKKTDKK